MTHDPSAERRMVDYVVVGGGPAGEFLRRGSGLLTSNAAEAGGFVRSRPTVDRPDLQKAH